MKGGRGHQQQQQHGPPSAPPLPGAGDLYPSADLPCALEEPPPAAALSAPLLASALAPPAAFRPPPAAYYASGGGGGGEQQQGGGYYYGAGGGGGGVGGGAGAGLPPSSYYYPGRAIDAAETNAFAGDLAVASARVRGRFVSKVFGLLLAQLLVVALIAALVTSAAPYSLAASPALLGASAAASLSVMLVLSCSERARRAHPLNLALLCVFSAAQGLLVAAATAGLGSRVVADAVLVTALAVAAMAAYAFCTASEERDFAATDGMLLTALVCFSFVLVARTLLPRSWFPRPVDLLISACGALIFCAYVAFDLQLLVRGDHPCALSSADDYVLAVLTIEVDVINLFLYVLDMVRAVEGDEGR